MDAAEEARRNLVTEVQRTELTRLSRAMNLTRAALTDSTALLAVSLPQRDGAIFQAAVEAVCTHLLTGDHTGRRPLKLHEGSFSRWPRPTVTQKRPRAA